MRKVVVFALSLCFLLAGTVASWAVEGPQGVQYGWHNLSSGAPNAAYRSTNEEEVCIFCHTPHGGDVSYGMPLWNRSNPSTTGWSFYNSNTLSAAGKPTAIGLQSLMCLSCHDGTVAVNRILNPSGDLTPVGSIGQQPDISGGVPVFINEVVVPVPGAQSKRIGTVRGGVAPFSPTWTETHNLKDDHPISINYNAAYAFDSAGLNDPVFAEGRGVRFFGDAPERRIECPSCHDPHVNYEGPGGDGSYSPFLMTTNSYSYLCLSCHNK